MQANGYSADAIKTLWDALCPSPTTRFNKAHAAAYGAGLLLDRLPQGELPRRVHGRAAHQRARRQGQVGALPQRVPPDGHQGAAARRQRVRRPTSPPSAPTSGSGWPRSATSAPTSSTAIVRSREEKGRVRLLQGLPAQDAGGGLQQAHDRVADQGRRVRRPRPHPPGLVEMHEQFVDALVDVKRKEAFGQDSLFGARFGPTTATSGGSVASTACRRCPTIEWDKQTLLAFEREMLGLYVSDHPLFGIEHVLIPARRHLDRRAHRRRARSPTAPRSSSPGSSPACRSSGPRRATSGRSPRSRTSTAPSSACSSPARLHDRRPRCCAPTSSASCAAG